MRRLGSKPEHPYTRGITIRIIHAEGRERGLHMKRFKLRLWVGPVHVQTIFDGLHAKQSQWLGCEVSRGTEFVYLTITAMTEDAARLDAAVWLRDAGFWLPKGRDFRVMGWEEVTK